MEITNEVYPVIVSILKNSPMFAKQTLHKERPTRSMARTQELLYWIYESKFNNITGIESPSVTHLANNWTAIAAAVVTSANRANHKAFIDQFLYNEDRHQSEFLIYLQSPAEQTCELPYDTDTFQVLKKWYDEISPFIDRWNPVVDCYPVSTFTRFFKTFTRFEKKNEFALLRFSPTIATWFIEHMRAQYGIVLTPVPCDDPTPPPIDRAGIEIDFQDIKGTKERLDGSRIHR